MGDTDPESKPWVIGGYYPYGNGYAVGHTHGLYYGHYLGKRSADAEPEAHGDPEAKPWIVGHYPYGNGYALGHGLYYGGLYGHYLGKRSADAESEAKPESNPWYYGGYGYGLGYGGYGLGYGGYGGYYYGKELKKSISTDEVIKRKLNLPRQY